MIMNRARRPQRQQGHEHWTLQHLRPWLSLPIWSAEQAAALISGMDPDRQSTGTLEMLDGESFSLPPTVAEQGWEFILTVNKIKNDFLRIANAHEKVRACPISPTEWLALAEKVGMTPDWLTFAKDNDLLPIAAKVEPANPCDVFRAMENLTPEEVSITFVGDKNELGICINDMLEISARNQTKLVALAEFKLLNRTKKILNKQGVMLLGMAQSKRVQLCNNAKSSIMKRLRKIFKEYFGVKLDPFEHYRKSVGWIPRFKITDKRGAADERAKREAENYRTESLEQGEERGIQHTDTSETYQSSAEEYPFDKEKTDKNHSYSNRKEKVINEWLDKNDPKAKV